jgi:hypothetical protein
MVGNSSTKSFAVDISQDDPFLSSYWQANQNPVDFGWPSYMM